MMKRNNCLFVLLFFLPALEGYKVQLFKELDFKGLIYDYEGDEKECHTLKAYARGLTGSIKTNRCLLIYEQEGCGGYSSKVEKDESRVSTTIGSFHPCREDYGGSRIHVRMMNGGGETIADYQNICTCQDLPSQVTTELKSLDNHGNCVTVYSTDSCSGNEKVIQAGRNGVAEDLPELGWYVRSISACGNKRGCAKLEASIFKFVLNPDGDYIMAGESQEIDLATKTTFYNNGSATVYQVYEATSSVRESSTITMSKTITSMESHKVENSTSKSWGVSIDIPGVFSASVNVANGLEKGYTTEKTESSSESNSYTHEEVNDFTVRQIIKVPPCTEYQVSAMVQMTENLPIVYEVYSKVRGEWGGKRMTGEEVRSYVDGMTFVEMEDEYTAVYKDRQSAVASVGVDAKVSGEGVPIEWCSEQKL